MNIINKVLCKYVNGMKLTKDDKYVYLIHNDILGGVVLVSVNGWSVQSVPIYDDISTEYINKVYSVPYINGETFGYKSDVGILDTFDYTTVYNIIHQYQTDMKKVSDIVSDITSATDMKLYPLLNNDEVFYNEILMKRKSDGAGRYILGDRVIYLSPSILPGTKKNDLDAMVYSNIQNNYFMVCFTVHKSFDINMYMRFLNL